MKKIAAILLTIATLTPCFSTFSACVNPSTNINSNQSSTNDTSGDLDSDILSSEDEEIQTHVHSFSPQLSYDDIHHYYKCECGNITGILMHNFTEWEIIKEATETENGQKTRKCTSCDYVEEIILPCAEHTHEGGEWKSNELSHWKVCSCGEKLEVWSHSYNDWTIQETATDSKVGLKTRTCVECQYEDSSSIPMTTTGEIVYEWKNITIQNLKTEQYMNYDYGTLKNGTDLRVWPWDGSDEQLFAIDNISGTTYRILTNKSSKYAIDVYRGSDPLTVGQSCDIWEAGDDSVAQNLKFYLCPDGSYILRLASDTSLALASSGAKNVLKVVSFNENDTAQKWIFKDNKGNNVDIKTQPTNASTTNSLPSSKYIKTETAYTVDNAVYYEAKLTEAYNGVPANTSFFIDKNGLVVTNATIINKLKNMIIFNTMRANHIQILDGFMNAAEAYYDVYCDIQALNKIGDIVGKTSGTLIGLLAGDAYSLADLAIDVAGEVLSPESVKNAVTLNYLRLYSNNCVAYGSDGIKAMSNTYTDYNTYLEATTSYANCVASATVVDFIAGDTLRDFIASSNADKLQKYFNDIFIGLADSLLPDIPAVEITKYTTDGLISLYDFYESSGIKKIYEEEFNTHFNATQRTFEDSKAIADKLATPEASSVFVAVGLEDKLAVVKAKYQEGSRVSHSYEFPKTSAYECHGFACYALMSFWGTSKPGISNSSYTSYKATATESYVDKIRPGDLVRFRSGNYDHTIVITNVDDDYVYYCDCNSDLKCTFEYNKSMKKTKLAEYLVKNLNSQQVSKKGYILHYKKNNL